MGRQNLYVAFSNALLGVLFSLLLKGNLLIYVLTFIMVATILFIERKWIYEKVFKMKKWRAVVGYAVLVAAMAGFFSLITRPNRDVSLMVKNLKGFLHHLQPGEYPQAYEVLSEISKKNYSLEDFVKDHEKAKVQVQDFRIDEVELNEFDKRKAVALISTPFSIYGQHTLSFEMSKEGDGWRIVFSPSLLRNKNIVSSEGESGKSSRKKSKDGKVTHFFKSLF